MKKGLITLILTSVIAASSALAQMPFGGGPGGAAMNPDFAKLFGSATEASATAQFDIKDSRGEDVQMSMLMNILDGKTRMDMDLTQIKSGKMPPNAAAQMKRMGMDKMAFVSQPDKGSTLMIYPSMHAYAQMSFGAAGTGGAQGQEGSGKGKVDKVSLGKETIDGHPCDKNKVTFTSSQGDQHEATVWNATDLKDFPIKIHMTEKGSDITITYHDIKLEKPDAALFEAPADFTKYDSMQTLMQTEMMKRMGAGGPGR